MRDTPYPNGTALKLARQSRGMSRAEVARKIAGNNKAWVKRLARTMSKHESGEKLMTEIDAEAYSRATNYPVDFFYQFVPVVYKPPFCSLRNI